MNVTDGLKENLLRYNKLLLKHCNVYERVSTLRPPIPTDEQGMRAHFTTGKNAIKFHGFAGDVSEEDNFDFDDTDIGCRNFFEDNLKDLSSESLISDGDNGIHSDSHCSFVSQSMQ